MKRNLFLLLISLVLFASCTNLDEIYRRLDNHEERLSAMEKMVANTNSTIENLQKLLDAEAKKLCITSFENNKEGGYILHMSDGSTITLKDGKDGTSPTVGVKEENGVLYWTINGSFMLDADGNKIKAEGTDGISGVTPQMRVDAEGYWEVSIDNGKTWQAITDPNGNKVKAKGSDANIDLVITEDDTSIKIVYNGKTFIIPKSKPGKEEPVVLEGIKFVEMSGRYFGNWYLPFADDYNLVFRSGDFDQNGNIINGYKLTIPTFSRKLADYNIPLPILAEGLYNIRKIVSLSHENIPMTMTMGEESEFWGMKTIIGTYLEEYKDSSKTNTYLITSGTMKVSHKENSEFIFDFKDNAGVERKGYYVGKYSVENFNDNDKQEKAKRPWSTLTADETIEFPSDMEVTAYFKEDYLFPSLNYWLVRFFSEKTPGEMITLEMLTDPADGMKIKAGTYPVARTYTANTVLPGHKSFNGEIIQTWFGDLSKLDADGYSTKLGPIESGKMTVTESGSNHTFNFEFVDDAGNKITGTWTGVITIM